MDYDYGLTDYGLRTMDCGRFAPGDYGLWTLD